MLGTAYYLSRESLQIVAVDLESSYKTRTPRNFALFNLAIDSKLRACDLLSLRVWDIANGLTVQSRGKVIHKKTGRPVRFELTSRTEDSVVSWIEAGKLTHDSYLFPSRQQASQHLSVRQYARLMKNWTRRR